MEPSQREVFRLLNNDGAILKRSGKHCVWELSNGQVMTLPKTVSDHRGWKNSLADLKIKLGLSKRGEVKEQYTPTLTEKYVKRKTTEQRLGYNFPEHLGSGRDFRDILHDAVYGPPIKLSEPQSVQYHPKRTRRTLQHERHGEVKTYTSDQINILNAIRTRMGDAGVQLALDTMRTTEITIQPVAEATDNGDEFVSVAGLRKQIDGWKLKVKELRADSERLLKESAEAEKNAAELEKTILNAEQFAVQLEKTAGLIESPDQLFAELKGARGAKPEKVDGRRHRTKIRYIDEATAVLATSETPVKMGLRALLDAIKERTGDDKINSHSLYTALLKAKDDPEGSVIKVGTEWAHKKFRDTFLPETSRQEQTAPQVVTA